MNFRCQVCHAPSSGTHFGADVCRACSAFFRRSITGNPNYKCKKYESCEVTADCRIMCKKCRHSKCFKIGMKKGAVQRNRDFNGKSLISKQLSSLSSTPFLNRISEMYNRLQTDRKSIQLEPPRFVNYKQNIQILFRDFYLISDWIHISFNSYSALPNDQKDILRRNFYFQFSILESGFKSCQNQRNDVYFMSSGDFIDCMNLANFFQDSDEEQPISSEEAAEMFRPSFATYHRNVSIPMMTDNIDSVEFAALATLALFATGKSALNDTCDLNGDCDNKGSICLRGRCRCHPHYQETKDEKGRLPKCSPLLAKVGAKCANKCREPLFCRNGECQCVQRGTTRISNGECVTTSRVGDRCSRHYDCTSPFSACLNSQCVCISGTIQQGSRCVAAANCPLGGLPGQSCVRRSDPSLAFNIPPNQDNCPNGQVCVTAADSQVGHCCPVVCPLASHVDVKYSCDPDAVSALKCPSDSHFCHFLSDGSFSQAVCCRRPCNAMAPNALYANNQCIPRGQLNSACTSNAQCGGGEGMECMKGQCQCQQNFHPAVDVLTNPLKNPSQSCSRDCENESLSKDTSCMKAVPLNSLCFIQKQCPQNSGCYRGRCMCRCGFAPKNGKCVEIPAPSTTTSAPAPAIIPGVPLNPGSDLFNLFNQFLGGANGKGGINFG